MPFITYEHRAGAENLFILFHMMKQSLVTVCTIFNQLQVNQFLGGNNESSILTW